jgi:hypothetical protein
MVGVGAAAAACVVVAAAAASTRRRNITKDQKQACEREFNMLAAPPLADGSLPKLPKDLSARLAQTLELTEEQVVARRLGTVRAMERWVASAEGVEAPTEGDHALIADNSSISMRARAAATAVPPSGLRARTPPDCNTPPTRVSSPPSI